MARGGSASSGHRGGSSSFSAHSSSRGFSSSRSSSSVSRGGGSSYSSSSHRGGGSRPVVNTPRPTPTYPARPPRSTYYMPVFRIPGYTSTYRPTYTRTYTNVEPVPSVQPVQTVSNNSGTSFKDSILFYLFWGAVILIALVFFMSMCSNQTSQTVYNVSYTHQKMNQEGIVQSSTWIDDELGWLNDSKQVVQAMEYFQDKTGVQPYLIITDNVNGKADFTDEEAETWLRNEYSNLFSEEGHMIVVFVEYYDSMYADYVYAGRVARGTIDDEAADIILNYLDAYYTDSSLDDNEYFAKVFRSSANSIMTDYEAKVQGRNRLGFAIVGVCSVVVCGIVVMFVISKIKEKRIQEYEAARALADTPVENVGSPLDKDIYDDLEKKYLNE